MKRSKKTGLYQYLTSLEGLDWNNKHAVNEAKKKYYAQYKLAWAKHRRVVTKQLLVTFTLEEAKEIETLAKKHGLTKNRFIKQACFAYLKKRYLPIDPYTLATIRQTLGQNCIALQVLFTQNLLPYEIGKRVIAMMESLEAKVLFELYNPKEISE